MCAPLWSQDTGKALGVVQLDSQGVGKKFVQDDLNFLMAVASLASVALENARLQADLLARERQRRDLELARRMIELFLGQHEPQVPGYEFYACYEPAQEVGGDYFDFVSLPQGQQRLAILLGDVAGKGLLAALLVVKLSSDVPSCLLREADPAVAVSVLNDLIVQHMSRTERFVTLAVAVLDPTAHTLTILNVGHPAPLIWRRATDDVEVATSQDTIGLPLGVQQGYTYRPYQVQLQPGDCVLLYSDGVTDQLDKEGNRIGQEAIHTAIQERVSTPQKLGERIVKILKQHASGRDQSDDITLVCFGRTETDK
jgi:serine phosphatase RsbU (regulator of sigma subunit)